MNEEVAMFLDDAKERMQGSLEHLENELSKIRAGKATPAMLAGISVDYYGVITPLNQVANVGTMDAKTIVIQPWEKAMLSVIEKEIMKANLGFNPVNNGELIRIVVPALTEERRKSLMKQVRNEGETAKIAIRNIRRETNDEIKKLQKDGLPEDEAKVAEINVQKSTDENIAKVDKIIEAKEKDIMSI
jgi:ribosome recycling factor